MKALRVLLMAIAIMMASGAMAQMAYNSSGSSCGKIERNHHPQFQRLQYR